jgi:hypothetical protein
MGLPFSGSPKYPVNTGRYEILQCTVIERALELTGDQKYVSYNGSLLMKK